MEQSISLAMVMVCVGGYLLGSIPFGLLLTKFAGTDDIRKIGSKNIGTTNVLRTGRKDLAVLTLIGDVLKGTLAVLLARLFTIAPEANTLLMVAGGFCAFIGHIYPVWLKFKGGKGVATYIGVVLGLSLILALILALIWLIVAFISRYSSLAALVSCAITAIISWIYYSPLIAVTITIMTMTVFYRERSNIARLVAGEETKIKL